MQQNHDEGNNSFKEFKSYFEQLKNKNIDICPPADLLSFYYQKKLNKKQMRELEEHINICPLCLTALESLIKSELEKKEEVLMPEKWSESEQVINNEFYSHLESIPASRKQVEKVPVYKEIFTKLKNILQTFHESFLYRPKLAYAGTFTILIIVGFYSYAYFSRPAYFYLAQIETESQTVLRSENRISSDLAEGLKFFDQGDYKSAITKLKLFLNDNRSNFAANYYLGLSYLFNARQDFLILPINYDVLQVVRARRYLNIALKISQDNQFYQENCYWYLGKAYLMSGEAMKAEVQFKNIVELDHPNLMRKVDAREMIMKIKQIKAH
jgi:tetratricopeptide (TPR) repeat protein